jgi:hypothetical protein
MCLLIFARILNINKKIKYYFLLSTNSKASKLTFEVKTP